MHVFRLKDNQCEFNRLERLVNKNLRTALGFRQSNPINILIAEVKKAPLDLRFSFLLSTFMIRCLPQKQTLVLNSFNYLEMAANLSAKRKQALVSIFFCRIILSTLGPLLFTDSSKSGDCASVRTSVFSAELNLCIQHKLPPEHRPKFRVPYQDFQIKEQMHTTGTTPPGADFMMNLSKGKRSLRSPGFGLFLYVIAIHFDNMSLAVYQLLTESQETETIEIG
ncbi:hypothetical protein ALC56_05480 [Trachymyrmex septentrionalis]|uniref:Uncharacterized protein n=1 Tax=Trachymyrmex septentrionalis TaxID=34720 RepID=A0A151JYP1_9HYME|nr:hypothetical protein ALC56_05480 [Trachymyrmex septentrionalis]